MDHMLLVFLAVLIFNIVVGIQICINDTSGLGKFHYK